MGKSKVIDRGRLSQDSQYEYGFNLQFTICDETVGSENMVMGHTIMLPGTRNQAHIHTNAEVMWFLVKGHTIHYIDTPARDSGSQTECFDGTCGWVSPGEIHVGMNLSDTEAGEVVFCYAGANNKEKAGTVMLDSEEIVDDYRKEHGQEPLKK